MAIRANDLFVVTAFPVLTAAATRRKTSYGCLFLVGACVADFVAVIRRTVDGLSENTPEMRGRVFEKARGAIRRQLESMNPRPSDDMINRQLSKLEAAIREVETSYSLTGGTISGDLMLSGARTDAIIHVPPDVPGPELGPSFALQEDGRVKLVPASFANESDIRDVGGLLIPLVTAIDELVALTLGSNSHGHLHKLAKQYREAVEPQGNELAIDLLYFRGIRLQNSAKHIREQIASGDYPNMSLEIAETLDSVLAVHGPMIMSTETGRDLVRKAKDYSYVPEVEDEYKAIALKVMEEIQANQIVDETTGGELRATNEAINDGPDPRMSTQAAHITNANLLNKLAKITLLGSGALVASAVAQSSFATVPANAITGALDHIWAFITTNPNDLVRLAALSGADLAWLPSFVRWAETSRAEVVLQSALSDVLKGD